MKTTMITRSIANPRRTTLADVQDAEEMSTQAPVDQRVEEVPLPLRTANPRRTVLVDAPQ